jgi:hypothetical protein
MDKVGVDPKADPAAVAKDGFEAMQAGKADVVSGWKRTANDDSQRHAERDAG